MSAHKQPPLLSMSSLEDAAEFLRVLGHPARLRMVEMLLSDRYCVGELAEACDVPSHFASEHLRLMQHCGLLKSEKDGRRTYYQIAAPQLEDIVSCIRLQFENDNRES